MAQRMLIACPDCAAIQEMPSPAPKGKLLCWRCEGVLERTNGRDLDAALACSLTTFLLLVPANFFAALTIIGPAGLTASIHLASGVATIWGEHWPLLAVNCALLAIILPFCRFGLLSVTLLAIKRDSNPPWLGPAFRYAHMLDLWAMPDVLLLGAAIAYGRVAAFTPVAIDAGGYCFAAAAFMAMITRASMDRRAIWRFIKAPPCEAGPDPLGCTGCDLVLPAAAEGRRCPRCAARVYRRKPQAISRSLALTVTGYILLPLANYYPMNILDEAGMRRPLTIFRGIELLFNSPYKPLAFLLFFTSIMIPFGKLMVLTWMFVSVWTRSGRQLRRKTKLYRLVDEIGRWSNLDPFAVLIYTPMVQFAPLLQVRAAGGALAFLAVVMISIVAARSFDPRLIWDAAHDPERPFAEAAADLVHPAANT